jgi:hypothetical protein
MRVITETRRALWIWYLRFYYYHWIDTSAGGLLVPEGIISPVVSVSALTWFIRYNYYWNLQFLNIYLLIKTKVSQLWLFCLGPLILLLPNTFTLFDFPIFGIWFWAYLMMVIYILSVPDEGYIYIECNWWRLYKYWVYLMKVI